MRKYFDRLPLPKRGEIAVYEAPGHEPITIRNTAATDSISSPRRLRRQLTEQGAVFVEMRKMVYSWDSENHKIIMIEEKIRKDEKDH